MWIGAIIELRRRERPRRLGVVLAVALALAGSLRSASGESKGGLRVSYNRTPVVGRDKPCITLTPATPLSALRVTVRRPGRTHQLSRDGVAAGRPAKLCWNEPPGRYRYRVTLEAHSGGVTRMQRLKLTIAYLPQLTISLVRKQIDLARGSLAFSLSQPARRALLVARSRDGRELARVTRRYGGAPAGRLLRISWPPPAQPIARIDLRVYNTRGQWAGKAIRAWRMTIAHREVVFESDRWTLRPAELPKLDAAIARIRKAAERVGAQLPVQVYVAGFTDTVGGRAHNRALSQKRARAIARYFSRHGVKMPVFYRGFGEEALAVTTADETPEVRNRRALYVLANEPPTISRHVRWGRWTRAR